MVAAHQDLIREAASAFDERDVEQLLLLMHPEADMALIGGFESVMGGAFHGEEGVRRFCHEWFTAFKTMTIGIEQLLDAGESILALTRFEAEGTESDVPVDLQGAAIYSFRDGKISRIDFYYDRDLAIHDAGAISAR